MKRRILGWMGYSVLLLVAVVMLAVGWALYTQAGAQRVLNLVLPMIPDARVQVTASGRLAGPLTLSDVEFETAQVLVRAKQVDLQWSPTALLDGVLDVKLLSLQAVSVQLRAVADAPSDEPDAPLSADFPGLPVDIVIKAFQLQDFVLLDASQAEVVRVNKMALQAHMDSDVLQLQSMSLDMPQVSLEAQARVENEDDLPLELQADYNLRLPDLPASRGRLQVSGSLAELQLDAGLGAPYNLALQGEVNNALNDLRVNLQVALTDAQLGWLNPELQTATATANVQGSLADLGIDLDGQLTPVNQPVLHVNLQARYGADLRIQQARLRAADSQVNLQGAVLLAEQSVELAGSWQDLRWPLTGADDLTRFDSPKGEFSLTGDAQAYVVALDGDVVLPDTSKGVLRLNARGSQQHLNVSEFTFDVLGGQLSGLGNVVWQPEISATFKLQGRGLDPGYVLPDWPGNLNLQAQGQARNTDQGWTGEVKQLQMDGVLQDKAVQVDIGGTLQPSGLQVAQGQVQFGASTLLIQGQLSAQSKLSWQLRSADLGELVAQVKGSLQGQGEVTGHWQAPLIDSTLQVDEFWHPSAAARRLHLAGRVSVDPLQPSGWTLLVNDVTTAFADFNQIQAHMDGPLAEHTASLSAQGEWGELRTGFTGGWRDEQYAVLLNELRLPVADNITLQLVEPVRGQFSAVRQQLQQLCLAGAEVRLCGEFAQAEAVQQASFELQALPLAAFNGLLPRSVTLQGAVTGGGQLRNWSQGTATPLGEAQFSFSDVSVSAEQEGSVETLLAFAPGTARLQNLAAGTELDLQLPLQGTGGIFAGMALRGGQQDWQQRTLDGQLNFSLPDLTVVEAFTQQIYNVQGQLGGRLDIAGTLAQPALAGELTLADGSVQVAELDITIAAIQAQMQVRADGNASANLSARSGGGALQLQGDIKDVFGEFAGRFTMTGKDFEVINNDLAAVKVSPDVTTLLSNGVVRVNGQVRLPTANVHLDTVPQSAVQVSSDQVIVDTTAADADSDPTAVYAELDIKLGEDVRFEGLGLVAKFTGGLHISEHPNEVTTAKGEVVISEGQYTAYGQDLNVQNGKLIWVGGHLDDPGIDILATRQPKPDVKVGVRARGTLANPTIALTSTPAMPESDQLAYLILGRPMENSSASEGSYLSKAALALGIKGGNYLTERYGDKLGVDQIGIETAPGEDAEQAALVVGKYLSPRLYVSYGLGLLDSISTLRLEYTLSKHWSLKTESSAEQSGGDLKYSIEVD